MSGEHVSFAYGLTQHAHSFGCFAEDGKLICGMGGPVSDTYSIKIDGSEVGRVSGERIECGKRLVDKWSEKFEDDLRLLRIVRDGKSVAVFYVSASENVSVEKVEVSA